MLTRSAPLIQSASGLTATRRTLPLAARHTINVTSNLDAAMPALLQSRQLSTKKTQKTNLPSLSNVSTSYLTSRAGREELYNKYSFLSKNDILEVSRAMLTSKTIKNPEALEAVKKLMASLSNQNQFRDKIPSVVDNLVTLFKKGYFTEYYQLYTALECLSFREGEPYAFLDSLYVKTLCAISIPTKANLDLVPHYYPLRSGNRLVDYFKAGGPFQPLFMKNDAISLAELEEIQNEFNKNILPGLLQLEKQGNDKFKAQRCDWQFGLLVAMASAKRRHKPKP